MPSGRQPKNVEAERAERLEGVVGVVQHEGSGGGGVLSPGLAQKDFKAIGFEPKIVIEEPEVFAGRLGRGEVVALAVTFVARMLDEASVWDVREEFACELV